MTEETTVLNKKIAYVKPILLKIDKMTFPAEIVQHGRTVICKQCSSCHGCR